MAKSSKKSSQRKMPTGCSNFVEAVVGAILTGIFLVLFNAFYEHLSFLTEEFDKIRGIYNISLIVSFVFLTTRIFIHSQVYKSATQIITNIFFFVIAYLLWTRFPFDTSVIGDQDTWDFIFKALIILPTIAVTIGTVVEIGKLSFGAYDKNKK